MHDKDLVDDPDPPWYTRQALVRSAATFATVCPLLAAVVAPLSILLDIPALAETWYVENGLPLPDPPASLVLSALSLALSILADALLLVRFSVWEKYWRIATHVSVICWVVKWFVGLSNLIVFGILSRNAPQFSYDEGFYCSVLAFITASLVTILLLYDWIVTFLPLGNGCSRSVRGQGRHFMIHNLFFTLIIGVTAGIMLRLEGWSYLQSIYFSVVTFTTIGFGDFYPSTTASRIVMFPLALLGIAELSALIGLLINFFSSVNKDKLHRSRLKFERQRRLAEEEQHDPRSLQAEIEFLEQLHRKRSWQDHAMELGWSLSMFLTFWLAGAVIFSRIEGWDYGTGLYFVYVFFFAIGYGDVCVQTPAGRTVFVVYALLAVPVMTSFAVQTVAGIFSRLSAHRMDGPSTADSFKDPDKWKPPDEETAEEKEEEIVSHAEYVSCIRKELDRKFVEKHEEKGAERLSTEEDRPQEKSTSRDEEKMEKAQEPDVDAQSSHTGAEMEDEDRKCTVQLLDTAAELERLARRLLINNLPRGSSAQILLKADWHVQLQEMRAVLHEEADAAAGRQAKREQAGEPTRDLNEEQEKAMRERVDREAEAVLQPLGEREMMQAVRRYRECFATMLVLGSRLRKLQVCCGDAHHSAFLNSHGGRAENSSCSNDDKAWRMSNYSVTRA
ncbi:voltage-gated potassium channel [Calocera viscosa TUFC12733]|uniref:Voltage-gated potassium channel n=1 Tax=Calocera viscosa (strain TUFC12733) TaxID=1330018 RepID=A0A167P6G1_CALVF|nr:voltage-gated potassium channel [Calocera viscosa TUFC12733]